MNVIHCEYCGVEVRKINYALGEEWMHSPYPGKPGEAYRNCRNGTVASPDLSVWLGEDA